MYDWQTSPKAMNMVTSLTPIRCAATIHLGRAFWCLLFLPSSLLVSQALPVAASTHSELGMHSEKLRELKSWSSGHHIWLRQSESARSNRRSSPLVSRGLLVYLWLLGCGRVQQLSWRLETTQGLEIAALMLMSHDSLGHHAWILLVKDLLELSTCGSVAG